MNQFALFAALLGLVAVALVISPLWKGSRPLALALAVGLPLAAAALYHLTGEPAAIDAKVAKAANAVAAPEAAAMSMSMEEAVAKLEQRVAAEPDNLEGVALLARSYMAMEKYQLARDAYAKAVKLSPDDTDLSVEYAESMVRTSPDHSFPPEAIAMLEKAVAKDPMNQRALFFLGTQRMHDNQPAEAVAIWEKLLPQLEPAVAVELRPQIDAARLAAGMPPLPQQAAPAPAHPPMGASEGSLNIEVQIDPALAKTVKPGDVVYVFARSVDGSGPPFAAKRIELGNLPLQLQLSDSDSPMPAAKLSLQKNVLLVARLSRTGDVKAASGDIEAAPLQVAIDSKEQITLILNRPVP
jgi:cytochrome c-type biogenesis protein CcmH